MYVFEIVKFSLVKKNALTRESGDIMI
jgi:hypothetical protein